MSNMFTPRKGRVRAVPWRSSSMIGLACVMAMEKPMFWASPATAVLMPTTSPAELTSGPPEFPGLMAASVWITCSRRGAVSAAPLPLPPPPRQDVVVRHDGSVLDDHEARARPLAPHVPEQLPQPQRAGADG